MTVLAQILLLAGLCLILAECFIPGFGICGITGILLTVAYVVLTMLYTPFGFVIVCTELAFIGTIMFLLIRVAFKRQLFGKVILEEALVEAPRDVFDLTSFIGRTGKTKTSLRPQGVIDFNGTEMEAKADAGYIAEDNYVIVTRIDGSLLVVKRLETQKA